MTDQNKPAAFACPYCHSIVSASAKFCCECGMLLDADKAAPVPVSEVPPPPAAPAGTPFKGVMSPFPGGFPGFPADSLPPGYCPPSDKGLKMLLDCCSKSVATGMGDLHDETVLYLDEASGEYQIHTYSNQFGGPEIHRGYRADKEVYDRIFALIRKLGLDKCQGGRDNGMCGGEYVCKFVLDDGRLVRLSTSNTPCTMHGDLRAVGSSLRSFIDHDREILPESRNCESGSSDE